MLMKVSIQHALSEINENLGHLACEPSLAQRGERHPLLIPQFKTVPGQTNRTHRITKAEDHILRPNLIPQGVDA